MADLKRTPEEIKEKQAEYAGPYIEKDVYPVCLYLSDEEVEKLKLEKAQVGDEMTMTARVRVKSVSSRQRVDDPAYHNVELEFLEAELEKAKPKKSQAERMYGSDE